MHYRLQKHNLQTSTYEKVTSKENFSLQFYPSLESADHNGFAALWTYPKNSYFTKQRFSIEKNSLSVLYGRYSLDEPNNR